jgi:delta 1-pyrroline-5-carboxylate dehydrogenase
MADPTSVVNDPASSAIPLPWASFALKGTGAVAGGIQAYLQYQEEERQRKLQEQMLKSADDRAWKQLTDNERAYSDASTQRNANASLSLGQATNQNQSLRDKLMLLSGTVRR